MRSGVLTDNDAIGGAAQVAAAHCPNERTLDPAVCSYINRPTPTYAPASNVWPSPRKDSKSPHLPMTTGW